MEWDGSIKTLSEHEADDTREGECGAGPHLGSPASLFYQFSLLMRKDSLPNTSWYAPGDMAESILVQGGRQQTRPENNHCLQQPGLTAMQCEQAMSGTRQSSQRLGG